MTTQPARAAYILSAFLCTIFCVSGYSDTHNMCNMSKKWNLFWWELPPFIERRNSTPTEFHDHLDGEEALVDPLDVQGVMLNMFNQSMRICCASHRAESESSNFGIHIEVTRRFDNQEHMLGNLTDINTIAMPIMLPTTVASSNPTSMFIRMLDNTGMMYIAKHRDGDEMGNVVLEGFLNIWPLFMAVIIFTGYMAMLLWLFHLRQYLKVNSRPALARNYFEWYWCAFITAATVGYGDRVPRNLAGKTITMVWALVGLSLMSLFVATLTTMLTEHQSVMSTLSDMKNSRVGVLAGSVERRFVVQDGAKPIEYETTDQLVQAVVKGEVDGIALDHYTFHHLYGAKELRGLDYELATTPGITVGYILFGEDNSDLLSCLRLHAFLSELNLDSKLIRTISHSVTGRELKDEASLALQSTALNILTSKMRWQLLTLGIIFIVMVVCIAIADIVVRYRYGPKRSDVVKSAVNCHAEAGRADRSKPYSENDRGDNLDPLCVFRTTSLYASPDEDVHLQKPILCARCHAIVS